MEPICRLCASENLNPIKIKRLTLLECKICGLLQKTGESVPSETAEKERYLNHQNTTQDPGYVQHLMPIVELIVQYQKSRDKGIDFGCGPSLRDGLVQILEQRGFGNTEIYDPFFSPNPEILAQSGAFDFIAANEVIEHFLRPQKEFQKMKSLLKPDGKIYFRTEFWDLVPDLENWWYLRDSTHISFYSLSTMSWIEKHLGLHLFWNSTTHGILQKKN